MRSGRVLCVKRVGMVRFAMVATETIDRPSLKALRGDILHVAPIEAAMLKYRGEARFATDDDLVPKPVEPEPIPTPEPDPQDVPRRRRRARTYRTREMRAEP